MDRNNIAERYRKDRNAMKNGYYDYEEWLEERLIEAEAELKKLRVGDVVGQSEQLKAEQKAYTAGYNEGANEAATEILNR
tara:strand:- start:466 stop:705 length:240 start_codon:yes stop_codon:yes gene_type:complete